MTASTASRPTLSRVLGLPRLTLFGLSYMLPLTVFTTYGIVNFMTSGRIVIAYAITLAAMLFTALSYARMVRAYPVAGSVYAYARKSFGASVGFLSGWTLMLDYLLMPLLTYLVIGIYLGESFPAVPQWIWVIASAVVVTGLNILGVSLVSTASNLLIAFQVIFLLVFAVMALQTYAGAEVVSIHEAVLGSGGTTGALFAGAAVLCLSFLGFDAVTAMAEEAKNPRRTIPKAVMLVTLAGGGTFIIIAALANLALPDWQSYANIDSAALDVMSAAGGAFLTVFFNAAYIAGCFGAVLASQSTVTRMLFAMGRDRVLPTRVFGYVHPRFLTPVYASLIVGAIGLLALFLDLDLVASLISFGALIAFAMVNLAVIKHYYIDSGKHGISRFITYFLPPLIGLAMCIWLWTSLSATTLIVGLCWFVLGVVHLAVITHGFRRRPPEMQEQFAETE
ncbi:APC family permease [Brevibacterium luteolum]|uniref:APC family permease n=1 Tax=Brevibacterium luteolum TaxID=199591 RepID=UPI00223A7BC4|nr:APC family permease [Brevibacterium luteolum]